jgi:hypothetical protein
MGLLVTPKVMEDSVESTKIKVQFLVGNSVVKIPACVSLRIVMQQLKID